MRPLIAVVFLAALAPAAPVPKALKRASDIDRILGTWKVSQITTNGRLHKFGYDTVEFTDGCEVKLRDLTGNSGRWTYTVDSAGPRRMRWDQGGRVDFHVMYELDGDTLKMGLFPNGANLPAKLEPGEGVVLYEMTRDTSAR